MQRIMIDAQQIGTINVLNFSLCTEDYLVDTYKRFIDDFIPNANFELTKPIRLVESII